MLVPPKLKQGDTIGVFSPSSPISATVPVRYQRGKAYLEARGFQVKEGRLTGQRDGYRSGTIQERAEELNQLIRDPSVRCVMASIGGMNSNSLLPCLDYEALMQDPKIFVGYSDVTALLLGIFAKTGLVTYYGPALAASFGEFPPYVEETFRFFWDVVGEDASLPHLLPMPEHWTDERIDWAKQNRSKRPVPNQWITVCHGKASGRLIGGNLNTMQGIWGTPYMPEIQAGDLLLLEDSLKDAANIERSFSLLKLSGVFDRIGGLILGKHEGFNDCGTGRMPHEILQEVMGPVNFPVLAQFDCCHTHPMLTLPLGVPVELDADAQTVTLLA